MYAWYKLCIAATLLSYKRSNFLSENGQVENVQIGRIFTQNPRTKIVYYQGESIDSIFPGIVKNLMNYI